MCHICANKCANKCANIWNPVDPIYVQRAFIWCDIYVHSLSYAHICHIQYMPLHIICTSNICFLDSFVLCTINIQSIIYYILHGSLHCLHQVSLYTSNAIYCSGVCCFWDAIYVPLLHLWRRMLSTSPNLGHLVPILTIAARSHAIFPPCYHFRPMQYKLSDWLVIPTQFSITTKFKLTIE